MALYLSHAFLSSKYLYKGSMSLLSKNKTKETLSIIENAELAQMNVTF